MVRPDSPDKTRNRMRTIRRSQSLMDRLPDPVREFLSRRASELTGMGVLTLMIAISTALASWSVDDPSLNNATSGAIRNWLGRPGAMVADRGLEFVQGLRSYGHNLGVAFQLADDALDYSGRQAVMGKSVGDDFREAKVTLPVIVA